jgi:hypothetical protein
MLIKRTSGMRLPQIQAWSRRPLPRPYHILGYLEHSQSCLVIIQTLSQYRSCFLWLHHRARCTLGWCPDAYYRIRLQGEYHAVPPSSQLLRSVSRLLVDAETRKRLGSHPERLGGTFSYSPSMNLQGLITTNAASASTRDGSPQVHSKDGKSGFLYHGRSHGVGTSVGLVFDLASVESYQYKEHGYSTEIKCEYNTSTGYRLDLIQGSSDLSIPDVYVAHGNLSNGNQGHRN